MADVNVQPLVAEEEHVLDVGGEATKLWLNLLPQSRHKIYNFSHIQKDSGILGVLDFDFVEQCHIEVDGKEFKRFFNVEKIDFDFVAVIDGRVTSFISRCYEMRDGFQHRFVLNDKCIVTPIHEDLFEIRKYLFQIRIEDNKVFVIDNLLTKSCK